MRVKYQVERLVAVFVALLSGVIMAETSEPFLREACRRCFLQDTDHFR